MSNMYPVRGVKSLSGTHNYDRAAHRDGEGGVPAPQGAEVDRVRYRRRGGEPGSTPKSAIAVATETSRIAPRGRTAGAYPMRFLIFIVRSSSSLGRSNTTAHARHSGPDMWWSVFGVRSTALLDPSDLIRRMWVGVKPCTFTIPENAMLAPSGDHDGLKL